jgi:hypothetical protein
VTASDRRPPPVPAKPPLENCRSRDASSTPGQPPPGTGQPGRPAGARRPVLVRPVARRRPGPGRVGAACVSPRRIPGSTTTRAHAAGLSPRLLRTQGGQARRCHRRVPPAGGAALRDEGHARPRALSRTRVPRLKRDEQPVATSWVAFRTQGEAFGYVAELRRGQALAEAVLLEETGWAKTWTTLGSLRA